MSSMMASKHYENLSDTTFDEKGIESLCPASPKVLFGNLGSLETSTEKLFSKRNGRDMLCLK